MSPGLWKQQFSGVIKDFAQPIGMPLLRFLWSWTKRMVPLLVIFSFVAIWYVFFREWRDRRVDFVIGPQGGTSAEQAYLVERELRNEWSLWGPNYAITRMYTDGFQENHRRVNADLKGNVFGFAMDGLRDVDTMNVQTILPMDWFYLHFVYRKQSLQELGLQSPTAEPGGFRQPVSLAQWSKRVLQEKKQHAENGSANWPIKLYLGPQSSGTRSVVKLVLEPCKIKLTDVAATGIADLDEMHAALKQGTIDGAFFVAPLRSALMSNIATGSDCTLISIDKAADLAKSFTFLEKGTIPSYAHQLGDEESQLGPVQTIAVRRVLIASPYMNAGDAYRLATHVRAALGRYVPGPDASGRLPGPDGEVSQSQLGYELHPGALVDPSKQPAPPWHERNLFWIGPLALAMLISFFSEVKADVVQWLNRHGTSGEPPREPSNNGSGPSPAAQDDVRSAVFEEPSVAANGGDGKFLAAPDEIKRLPAPVPELAYVQIEGLVKRLMEDMRRADDAMFLTGKAPSKRLLRAWEERIAAIARAISDARRQGKLVDHVDTLKQYVVELRLKHDFLRQPLFRPVAVGARANGNRSRRTTRGHKPK